MDWDKIEQLLNVVDKARHWPNLKHLHDEAMVELQKPLDAHRNEPPRPKQELPMATDPEPEEVEITDDEEEEDNE